MGGKASILLVLGFSLIFLVAGHNFGNLSNRAVENLADYYSKTKAYNLAVSGANMAATQLFLDKNWNGAITDLPFDGGHINVTLQKTLKLIKLISKGTYNSETKTVIVAFRPSNFAKFAWYSGNMNSKVFVTGDTIWGPFHTQSKLNTEGEPVFWGKASSKKGLSAKHGTPNFYGGYESGVDIPLPVNYQFTEQETLAKDGETSLGGSSHFENTDLWMKFNADGTVTYRTGTGNDTSTYGPPQTELLTSFAPNEVIYVKKGDIYVEGKVNGQVIVVAGESSGSGHGNIYVNDDLTYRNDPMIWDAANNRYKPNNACTDMLGLLASNNVRVANTTANVADRDLHLDATIFCAQGGFQLEETSIPESGTVYLRGGMVAAKEELMATFIGGVIKKGYKKHVIFDERFLLNTPPEFPETGKMEIVSWFE
jgi:hypothetical protein